MLSKIFKRLEGERQKSTERREKKREKGRVYNVHFEAGACGCDASNVVTRHPRFESKVASRERARIRSTEFLRVRTRVLNDERAASLRSVWSH